MSTNKKKKNNHYVDNKLFLEHMIDYREKYLKSLENGEEKPRASDYIGRAILLIAENYANKSNFRNYPFKQDMIYDAVETCLKYMHNFDPAKSKTGPLSYFTRTIHFAFLNRIKKEKKELGIKQKFLHNLYFEGLLLDQEIDTNQYEAKIDLDNPYMSELVESLDNKKKEDKEKRDREKNKETVATANTVDQYFGVNDDE